MEQMGTVPADVLVPSTPEMSRILAGVDAQGASFSVPLQCAHSCAERGEQRSVAFPAKQHRFQTGAAGTQALAIPSQRSFRDQTCGVAPPQDVDQRAHGVGRGRHRTGRLLTLRTKWLRSNEYVCVSLNLSLSLSSICLCLCLSV